MGKPYSIFINGGFLAQPLTGVQRYAWELTQRLLKTAEADPDMPPVTLVRPAAGTRGMVRGNLWEQTTLCLRARNGILFSPGNLGPWLHPRHIVTMHDMRSFSTEHAESLPARSRLWHNATFSVLGKTARRILTDSHYSLTCICDHLHVSEQRVQVVYPGADHVLAFGQDDAVLEKLGLSPRGYVLAVGSLYPHKNLRILHSLDWAKYNLKLCIVGESPNTRAAAFQRVLEEARTQPASICYTGRRSDAELRALYSAAFAFAFPSLYEGFGFPPLEAMYCGAPVLASDRTSIPEVCGDAALYFDPLSPESLELAVERLLGDPGLRSTMIERGRQQAAKFTWARATTEVMSILQQII
jgi:glycosyltransferase involved in cell wall biosynthesis